MEALQLPHIKPIRFADKIIYSNQESARVSISFEILPSLAMMVEAAAQSSAALSSDNPVKEGFLLAMKDIVLIQKPTKKSLEVEIKLIHSFKEMYLIDFQVFEDVCLIVTGNLTIKSIT